MRWAGLRAVLASGGKLPEAHESEKHAGAGFGGIDFADDAVELIDGGGAEFGEVEGGSAGEEFVENGAEGVDVGTGVDVGGGAGLLGDMYWGVPRTGRGGGRGVAGEWALEGLGDAEVDDFGGPHAVLGGDEDIGGLEVAMDDAFLMGVLDGHATLAKRARRSGMESPLVVHKEVMEGPSTYSMTK